MFGNLKDFTLSCGRWRYSVRNKVNKLYDGIYKKKITLMYQKTMEEYIDGLGKLKILYFLKMILNPVPFQKL